MRTRSDFSPVHHLRSAAIAALLATLTALSACQSSGQTGLLAGAGIGALAGQAIGGNTTATLIGTGVGAGVGYVIGNERDRSQARDMTTRQQREIDDLRRRQEAADRQAAADRQPAAPTGGTGGTVVIGHDQTGPLAGSRWTVVSLSPRDVAEPFVSMIVEFRAGGRAVSTVTRRDGAIDVHNERYRVVGDTLIINAENYLINARFAVDGDELVLSADRFSAVLRRLAS